MIAPQEKANELIEHFAETIPKLKFGVLIERDWQTAKECAKVAVEMIIQSSPSLPILGDGGTFGEDIDLSRSYWQEVLKEINKL